MCELHHEQLKDIDCNRIHTTCRSLYVIRREDDDNDRPRRHLTHRRRCDRLIMQRLLRDAYDQPRHTSKFNDYIRFLYTLLLHVFRDNDRRREISFSELPESVYVGHNTVSLNATIADQKGTESCLVYVHHIAILHYLNVLTCVINRAIIIIIIIIIISIIIQLRGDAPRNIIAPLACPLDAPRPLVKFNHASSLKLRILRYTAPYRPKHASDNTLRSFALRCCAVRVGTRHSH